MPIHVRCGGGLGGRCDPHLPGLRGVRPPSSHQADGHCRYRGDMQCCSSRSVLFPRTKGSWNPDLLNKYIRIRLQPLINLAKKGSKLWCGFLYFQKWRLLRILSPYPHFNLLRIQITAPCSDF